VVDLDPYCTTDEDGWLVYSNKAGLYVGSGASMTLPDANGKRLDGVIVFKPHGTSGRFLRHGSRIGTKGLDIFGFGRWAMRVSNKVCKMTPVVGKFHPRMSGWTEHFVLGTKSPKKRKQTMRVCVNSYTKAAWVTVDGETVLHVKIDKSYAQGSRTMTIGRCPQAQERDDKLMPLTLYSMKWRVL